ncbi:hypothetical protein BDZ90DRAFT_261179 [Jaminaea rosea]|uniref:Autophagy-related protein 14 n=1 Tax=Jaminaea rosea TaxID=1569628 RepID=A0A316UNS7_9BASI|nr:hypothetical protein BDZ90DRAFT_261179 [Jaminaea rosea]PWN26929.1 hypothetical protein BDZ90DRAFT_261179 [Jaminaea rosea]
MTEPNRGVGGNKEAQSHAGPSSSSRAASSRIEKGPTRVPSSSSSSRPKASASAPKARASSSKALPGSIAAAAAASPSSRKTSATKPPAKTRSIRPSHPPLAAQGTEPKVCRHCRSTSVSFWCERCALAQLERFRDNIQRVGLARDEVKGKAAAFLGDPAGMPSATQSLPDPFGPQATEPHPIASHHGRAVRARWHELSDEVGQRKVEQMKSDAEVRQLRESVRKRGEALEHRRKALEQAKGLLASGSSRSEVEEDISRLRRVDTELREELASTRRRRQRALLEIYSVAPPSTSAPSSVALSKARARYVPGAFESRRSTAGSGLPIQPLPPSVDWTLLPPSSRLALPLPTASDIRRFPRSNVNAAAALTAQLLQRQAATCGVALPFSLGVEKDGRWALRSDPLWTGAGNGVGSGVTGVDSKHSLHLGKSAYELMAEAGGARGGLTVSQASPAASLIAAGGGLAREKIEQSLASLKTSTFASLGSFVQLPGRQHQTWSRASVIQEGGEGDEGASAPAASTTPSTTTAPSSSALTSAQTFCRALIMLAYDAAYLAWTQGAPVDLIAAGGSTLKLMAAAAGGGTGSGKIQSHADGPRALGDFTFPALDFAKLLQLHELGGSAAEQRASAVSPTAKSKASSGVGGSAGPPSRSTTKTTASALKPGLEDSYIDAGQAAASILDDKQSRRPPAGGLTSTSSSSSQHQPASAAKRQPSKSSAAAAKPQLPPSNLSSLRQRGQDVARQGRQAPLPVAESGIFVSKSSPLSGKKAPTAASKAAPSTQRPSKVKGPNSSRPAVPEQSRTTSSGSNGGGGTVTFNGQQIALGTTDSSSGEEDEARPRKRSGRREAGHRATSGGGSGARKEKTATAEDDWDVV